MELRDVVEVLAGLDDERRAITNGVQRALDALERAVLPPERFGLTTARIEALRERVQHGMPEAAALSEIGDVVRERLVDDMRLEGERLALLSVDRADHDLLRSTLDRFTSRVGGSLDSARVVQEQIGALRALLARRRDVDQALGRLRRQIEPDDVTDELLDLAMSARHAAGREPLGARAFLLEAESHAAASGLLAGVASNTRALREALRLGRDADAIASDLCRRAEDAATRLAADRDEARRLLALSEREKDRRQEISHGMFQAVTKATEVLERLDRFERLPATQRLADGALGSLKAACLEHGIVSVLVGLRELRVDRADFDAALSQVSQALGDLLELLQDRPETASVVPAWDDIAAVDARAQESEWESACREALGVRRDAQGLLAVAPETLSLLVSADSLEPLRTRLFQRIESKMTEVLRATERLERLDRTLSDLCDEGGDLAARAVACKATLTRFIGEALHVMGECHARFRERLSDPDAGFAQIQARVEPFVRVEDAAPAMRATAIQEALAEIRACFAELETRLPGGGGDAEQTRAADAHLREESAALSARLAASLASLHRLRELLLPPLPAMVDDAIALAARLRDAARPGVSRDHLGEALESLLHERLYLEALDMSALCQARPGQAIASERNRRLLAIVGASLTLGYELLSVLVREHEAASGAEREGHAAWMEELAEHLASEMSLHARLLDLFLTELPDNASRLRAHEVALGSHLRFLAALEGTAAEAELLARRGKELFAALEGPLGTLGAHLLDALVPQAAASAADWRVTSQVESLIDLHDSLLARLRDAPLRTDVAASVAVSRDRATALRDEIVERADAEPGASNPLFGG